MIVDCFPFFNELDLLEVRLHELATVVDKFVLAEATLTHSGKPKPLYYADNKDRFRDFPIEHVVVDAYYGIDKTNAWALEHYQRDMGVQHAVTKYALDADDIIVMTDCDEIPSASSVHRFQVTTWPVATIDMGMYYYWMNCRCVNLQWRYGKIFRPVTIPVDTNVMRRKHRRAPVLENGGWHFSYLGGVDAIQTKLAAFAHREKDDSRWNTSEEIQARMNSCRDLFDRHHKYEFALVHNLDFLPEYVKANQEKFARYLR